MKLYFVLFISFYCLAAQAQQAGTLDYSFGDSGKVLTSSPDYYLQCVGTAPQSDGSIVAGGYISSVEINGLFAVKYTPGGLVDSSFGKNGIAAIDSSGYALAIAVQADDKVLVAGYYAEMFGPTYISVARFNADGSVDASFGKNGLVINSIPGRAYAIALQPDGKILLEGIDGGNALTIRLLQNGTPDASFGNNGIVETSFGTGLSGGYAIAVQPDGKIATGGQVGSSLFLARYSTNGILDESFGSNGKVVYDFATGVDAVRNLLIQPDGKIIAVGSSSSYYQDTLKGLILRTMPDGSLDKDFGNDGVSGMQFKTKTQLKSVALQKNSKIVACGTLSTITGYPVHSLLERYATNGQPDTSFGTNGYVTTVIDTSDVAASVFFQGEDEKIVLGGSGTNFHITGPLQSAITLARYYNDDQSRKQIIITKIKRWIQHHNGIEWNNMPGTQSYAVQRSMDGQHWTTVYRSQVTAYSAHYSDPTPSSTGTTYYRLQTTSTSNAVANSNVIAISYQPLAISLSPNPAKNTLSIAGLAMLNYFSNLFFREICIQH